MSRHDAKSMHQCIAMHDVCMMDRNQCVHEPTSHIIRTTNKQMGLYICLFMW